MNFPPADDPNLPRKPVAPRIAEHAATGIPIPPDLSSPIAQRYQQLPAEMVTPRSDSPIRGWRLLGFMLMNRTLWSQEPLTNPLMVYYSGRISGRQAEDWIGLAPWLLLVATDAVLFFVLTLTPAQMLLISTVKMLVFPVLAGIMGILMTTLHMRRLLDRMPLEELLLTRLKPADIVQGLGIRPLIIQNIGIMLGVVGSVVMLFGGLLSRTAGPTLGFEETIWLAVLGPMLWSLSAAAAELSVSLSLRTNFFLRATPVAILRSILDWLTVFGWVLLLTWLFTLCAGGLIGLSLISLVFLVVFVAFTMNGIPNFVREHAFDSIVWTFRYYREWWVYVEIGSEDGEAIERRLLTPWKSLDRRRRYFPLPGRSSLRQAMAEAVQAENRIPGMAGIGAAVAPQSGSKGGNPLPPAAEKRPDGLLGAPIPLRERPAKTEPPPTDADGDSVKI